MANELGFFSVIIADMQIDGRIRHIARLSLFSKYVVSDFGLCTVNSDQHGTRSLCPILEHRRHGRLVVIIGNVDEAFVILYTQNFDTMVSFGNGLISSHVSPTYLHVDTLATQLPEASARDAVHAQEWDVFQ